jgi:hypothetical protein
MSYEAARRQQWATLMKSRLELLKELQELGVETIFAEYDGCGDSGQIHPPEFGSVEVSQATVAAVQDLFFEVLNHEYGGWALNEGSYGQFTWSVQEDRIHLVITDWTPRTNHTEEVYL